MEIYSHHTPPDGFQGLPAVQSFWRNNTVRRQIGNTLSWISMRNIRRKQHNTSYWEKSRVSIESEILKTGIHFSYTPAAGGIQTLEFISSGVYD
jgi:hypothetical protein